jgi:hypothetical protein
MSGGAQAGEWRKQPNKRGNGLGMDQEWPKKPDKRGNGVSGLKALPADPPPHSLARPGTSRPHDDMHVHSHQGSSFSAGGDGYTSIRAAANLYINGPGLDLAVTEFFKANSPVRQRI